MTVPFTVPITVITRTKTGVDGYGNDVYGETSATVQGVVAPADGNGTSGNENLYARDQVIVGASAYLPAGTVITALDKVTAGGQTFEVTGEPADWTVQPHPWTGWVPSLPIVAALRRVEG